MAWRRSSIVCAILSLSLLKGNDNLILSVLIIARITGKCLICHDCCWKEDLKGRLTFRLHL